MATNEVFHYSETGTEVWTFASELASGQFVIQNGTPAVTLTATGGYTVSTTVGPLTISGIQRGGASLLPKQATVATDGTWDLKVTGAVAGSVVQNTPVYAASDGSLTLTATNNTKVGKVNPPQGYVFHDTTLPVKIGVDA